jgi:hypothetical protein
MAQKRLGNTALAGFEPTIPVFKRAKTFHALDRAATVTGSFNIYLSFSLVRAKPSEMNFRIPKHVLGLYVTPGSSWFSQQLTSQVQIERADAYNT